FRPVPLPSPVRRYALFRRSIDVPALDLHRGCTRKQKRLLGQGEDRSVLHSDLVPWRRPHRPERDRRRLRALLQLTDQEEPGPRIPGEALGLPAHRGDRRRPAALDITAYRIGTPERTAGLSQARHAYTA